ncbi:helix-turn-helix transcriptional regulator [Catenulispora pinisilvae]|uniref:helix-turn-helix transcriptional regulator n=1 Tax=Catenulispora pinisilvae TaxID=2705253 RepID=UPI0018910621|nr:helix-turn-helix transcriptional regulator [Catenulispora pinisilvae]
MVFVSIDLTHPQAAVSRTPGKDVGPRRRSELASFLRSRRERLDPEQLGMPTGTRRRTPGLRREEVAQLAGVGVTWYTWLEQGRQINASVQVLDAVARTLRLDQAETEHLYRLADVPAVPAVVNCRRLDPEVQQILDGLRPLPASVVNGRSDILAWNRSFALLFPFMVNAPEDKRNSLWATFTSPKCCHPYVNRGDDLGRMVANFRARYGRHVGEPAWDEFVKRLCAASPEFAELWAEHGVAEGGVHVKVFRHPALGDLSVVSTTFDLAAAPETRMMVYTPNDQSTREKFEMLRQDTLPKGLSYPCGHSFEPPAEAELASRPGAYTLHKV